MDIKVLVLHYSKLVDRKKYILEQFTKHNITNYEFIELYDKDEISDLHKSKFIEFPLNNLGHMSLFLKHIHAFEEIANKYDRALIFEDDIILSNNFITKYNEYMKQLPDDYDMFFLGDGCKLHIPNIYIKENVHVYNSNLSPLAPNNKGLTRCLDSYVVTKKCAQTIINYYNSLKMPINKPNDHWLNDVIGIHNLQSYWAEPTIVTQGSETGKFKKSY